MIPISFSTALFFLEKGKKALEEKKRNNQVTDREMGILEKLLQIDEKAALIMTMDSIIAGVDTTGSAFFNLLHNLAHFPDKQELLRKEIMAVLADEETILTAENMQNMPYLRACMKESARFTPLFNNIRSAGRDLVIQGYQIPRETNMMLVQHAQLASDAQYPRAKEFMPERFIRSPKETNESNGCPKSKAAHPFIFTPFGKWA